MSMEGYFFVIILRLYCVFISCFASFEMFLIVQVIFFSKGCLRTMQFCLEQILQEKSLQASEWTNNSTDSLNSFFINRESASISACASFTFKYQGTVRWQSQCNVLPYFIIL